MAVKLIAAFVLICTLVPGLFALPRVDTSSSQSLSSALSPEGKKLKQCEACRSLMDFVERINVEYSDAQVKTILQNICLDSEKYAQPKNPQNALVKMCQFVANGLYSILQQADPESFCERVEACEPSENIMAYEVVATKKEDENVTCEFCISTTNNIKDILAGEETEAELRSLIQNSCRHLGGLSDDCDKLLSEYLDYLLSFVRDNLKPEKLCETLKLCPSGFEVVRENEENKPEIEEVINLRPGTVIPAIKIQPATKVESKAEASPPGECFLCKEIMSMVIKDLRQNRTREAIISALDRVCDRLAPSRDVRKCEAFVNQYTEEIINILTQETDPEIACALMGICVSEGSHVVYEPESEQEPRLIGGREDFNDPEEMATNEEKTTVSNELDSEIEKETNEEESAPRDQLCFECQTITHYIQNQLYDVKNEKKIEDFVMNELCHKLANHMARETCDSFVREYGPAIIQMIAQEDFDPKVVCEQELSLCPRSIEDMKSQFEMIRSSEACTMCENVVQSLDVILQNEQIDHEISVLVAKVCNDFPKNKQAQCRNMIEVFGPFFLRAIGHLGNPKQVCTAIDLCYNAAQAHLLGGQKCSYGPAYWCHTSAHANACKAMDYCQRKVWKPEP